MGNVDERNKTWWEKEHDRRVWTCPTCRQIWGIDEYTECPDCSELFSDREDEDE